MNRLPRGLTCLLVGLLLPLMVSPGVRAQYAQELECYYYTWTGQNVSVDCEVHKVDIMNEQQPCLDTLVYTDPPRQPPNSSDIKRQCETSQRCPRYTCKEKKACIKLMWYDITNTLVNYSSFCSNVIAEPDSPMRYHITSGLLEMQVGTFTKKLLVCNTPLCNTAAATTCLSVMVVVLSSLLPALFSS